MSPRLSHLFSAMFLLSAGALLAGCGTNEERDDTILTGEIFSVSCERSWSDCYAEAQRRCAGGDFEELDWNALERNIIDDHSFERPNKLTQATYRAVTVRCK
ncbi:MAG: hypothetical protein P8M18_01460 [Woeseiaceae bacterium]|nr:hypothetical protein [Woeseiaceae bacterium]